MTNEIPWADSQSRPVKSIADAAVLDLAGCRRLEQLAAEHLPKHTLMLRAGVAAARLLVARFALARRICVVTGTGNNAGDGWVCAWMLHRYFQREVLVCNVALTEPAAATDLAWAKQLAIHAGVQQCGPDSLPMAEVYVDALFGIGLQRPLAGRFEQMVNALNQSGKPILALDIASGLSCTSGQVIGQVAVQASVTITMLALKPGVLTGSAARYCGQVWLADLGVQTSEMNQLTAVARWQNQVPAPLTQALHKGERGDVWVLGGAKGMHGAAALTAMAALRFGAGRVYVVLLDGQASLPMPELMQRSPEQALTELVQHRPVTVVMGPGGANELTTYLPTMLASAHHLVLDADALNIISQDKTLLQQLANRAAAKACTVLTPHPLEASRLLQQTLAYVQENRLQAAQQLAAMTQAWVVLKGSGTVIVNPDGQAWINATGNDLLATAGSGDVLAGMIAARWRGQARQILDAVWLHGQQAEHLRQLGRTVITSSELLLQ